MDIWREKSLKAQEKQLRAKIAAMPIEEIIADVNRQYESLSEDQKAFAKALVNRNKV